MPNPEVDGPPVCRRFLAGDVEQVVPLHQEAFPRHFLTTLGRRFLNLYYQSIVESEFGIGVVASQGDKICGFAIGVVNPREFYSRLIRQKTFRLFFSCLGALLKKPSIGLKLARGTRVSEEREPGADLVELASLCVAPWSRGTGVGRVLVQEFLALSQQRGSRRVILGTRKSDGGTVEFYSKLGFVLRKEAPERGGDCAYEFHYELARDNSG